MSHQTPEALVSAALRGGKEQQQKHDLRVLGFCRHESPCCNAIKSTMYASGVNMQEIIDTMNAMGIRSGRGNLITVNGVTRMLHNRKYIGEYCFQDVVIPNGVPSIVPQELFDRVHERMASNHKAPAKHKAEDEYLLTTKLFCGHCQRMMVGESGTSHNGETNRYYKCVGVKKHLGCKKKSVKKDWIEGLV